MNDIPKYKYIKSLMLPITFKEIYFFSKFDSNIVSPKLYFGKVHLATFNLTLSFIVF